MGKTQIFYITFLSHLNKNKNSWLSAVCYCLKKAVNFEWWCNQHEEMKIPIMSLLESNCTKELLTVCKASDIEWKESTWGLESCTISCLIWGDDILISSALISLSTGEIGFNFGSVGLAL